MTTPLRYLRPSMLAELGPGANVVESSAGTGKTFLLEHLFVDLILRHHIAPEQILVVTFTEKATAELVLRLRRLVATLADLRADHPQAVAGAAAAPQHTWLIDDDARRVLTQALLGFDRITISTIHGFCQRVLAEHAFAQGRLFDEELVGNENAFADAFAETLRTRAATDADLSAALDAWLAAGHSVAELGDLLDTCDGAKAALRPALNNGALAAALAAWPARLDEMTVRRQLEAAKIRKDVVGRCLRRLASVARAVADSGGDGLRLVAAEPIADLDYLLGKLAGVAPGAAPAELAHSLATLRAALVPLEAVVAQCFLPVVQAQAAASKRAAGRFDFDDMLALVDRALADPGPAGRALTDNLRARYRHALIDEFQDTDEVQWSVFRRIFVDAGPGHGITVIGDPKQAIYGFRGANVGTYREARHALLAGQPGHLILDRNYRSTADLIGATNRLFADFFRPASGIVYGSPVMCGTPERALVPAAGAATPVAVWDLATAGARLAAGAARAGLCAAIVDELHALLGPRPAFRVRDGEGERALRARDVFILTFTNQESRLIGRALAAARIPYAFYKQDKLFETAEAGEILDVLRALCAPADRGLRARALLSRFFGLALPDVAAAVAPDAPATRLLFRLAALAETGNVPALFSALVEETGVLRRELCSGGGERGLTNFMHVLELLQAEWARTHLGVPELCDVLGGYVLGTARPPGRDRDVQRLETDADAVQILTVHKAKGLEADVVFVFGGTGRGRPSPVHVIHQGSQRMAYIGTLDAAAKQRWEEEQLDEHGRLLYVAATRARYRLYLPLYPDGCRVDGPYAAMNERLGSMLATGDAGFERRSVVCPAAGVEDAVDRPASADPTDGPAPAVVPAELATLRETRRGFVVTSYTAVKRARAGTAAGAGTDVTTGVDEQATADPLPAGALPGGAATGIFVHEILARVELAELAARPSFARWFANPAVRHLIEQQRRRLARPSAEIEAAARLVHAAYTTPVRVGDQVMPALAAARSALREMEFLYPIPEAGHPRLERARGAPAAGFTLGRGVVKGFIDYLFEQHDRVYICDWKSDVLPDYAPEALAEHCALHYDVQTRLYTLAALRLCDIHDRATFDRRWGGMLFCFLRGRGEGSDRDGMVWLGPSWADVLRWESEMLTAEFWGLGR